MHVLFVFLLSHVQCLDIVLQIVASQREVGSLRKRLGDADNQLPDLEDAKKLAVSGEQ